MYLDFEYQNWQIHKEVLESVLDSKNYILAPEAEKFEAIYAAFNQTKYSIGVVKGLVALRICLICLEIGHDNEVIVLSNFYIVPEHAFSLVAASTVPAEPRIDLYNINQELIKGAITPRIKAIIPVLLYGQL